MAVRSMLTDFHSKDSFQEFRTELRTLFEFLRYSDDKGKIDSIIRENEDRYLCVDNETARLIAELAGIDGFDEILEKIEEKEGKAVVNMCKAWEDQKLAGKTEGKIEGKIEALKNIVANMIKNGMPDPDICKYAMCDQQLVDEVRKAVL